MSLSRTREDMQTETLGDTLSVEEFRKAREQAERMIEEDEALAAFNEQWADELVEAEIDSARQFIRQLRRRQPLPQDALPENEEYAMAVVLLLKMGFIRVADFLKTCTNVPEGFEWDEIQEQLDKL